MQRHLFSLILTLLLTLAGPAHAAWEPFNAREYGFSMLVPNGIKLESHQWQGGWAGVKGQDGGVTIHGLTRLGAQIDAEAIAAYGVELTGIAEDSWTEVDEGTGNGWTWYQTVTAEAGSRLIVGAYGAGPKGSYLILLETTTTYFQEHEADFEKWYESVRLH